MLLGQSQRESNTIMHCIFGPQSTNAEPTMLTMLSSSKQQLRYDTSFLIIFQQSRLRLSVFYMLFWVSLYEFLGLGGFWSSRMLNISNARTTTFGIINLRFYSRNEEVDSPNVPSNSALISIEHKPLIKKYLGDTSIFSIPTKQKKLHNYNTRHLCKIQVIPKRDGVQGIIFKRNLKLFISSSYCTDP